MPKRTSRDRKTILARLNEAAREMRRHIAAIDKTDVQSVELDIAGREHDAEIGRWWAATQEWLAEAKIKPTEWLAREELGSLTQMTARKRLHKEWYRYVRLRRKAGPQPYGGLAYALNLLKATGHEIKTGGAVFRSDHGSRPHHHRLKNVAVKALAAQERVKLLEAELAKIAPKSPVLHPVAQPVSILKPKTKSAPALNPVIISDARVYRADLFDAMAQVRDGSVDLICGDLPYAMTGLPWDTAIDLNRYFGEALRILKSNGVILMCVADPFDLDVRLACRELYRFRWHWWDNGPVDNHLHTGHHPLKIGESVLVFSPSGREFAFNPQKVRREVPKVEFYPTVHSRAHKVRRLPVRREPAQYHFHHPTNLLYFPTTSADRWMTTQKPLAMCSYFVRTYANPGDTVADLTCGSGTFGTAAVMHGCKFVGSERDKKHFDYAVRRIRGVKDSELADAAD